MKNFHLGDGFRRLPLADFFSRICRHPADLCHCIFEAGLDRVSEDWIKLMHSPQNLSNYGPHGKNVCGKRMRFSFRGFSQHC